MLSSEDLRFFLTVAAARSLADAARTLDVTPPAVTQRLAALEKRLGIRLVERTGRRVGLTDEGHLLAARGRRICDEIGLLADALGSRRGVVAGHLRVLAPLGFGHRYVAPAVARVRRDHPEVTATLTLSDRPGRHAEDSWDVMVHIGELRDSALVMQRIASNRRILCAAPAYLRRRGAPSRPQDLRDHECIALRENDEDVTLWRFTGAQGETASVRIDPVLASTEGSVVHDWAVAGMGIMVRSEWDVAGDLRAGRLVALLPAWRLPDADVIALLPSREVRSARTSQFLACLRAQVRAHPWDAGQDTAGVAGN
ncbi:LysR family transcriptional regulator [Bordetella bronchialis]|uniref:LysR family transcriptional regulator n=1 Tax=Bordetella bronchialis TaxID=463025 RepID=A0ABN4R2H0_9BORD|nr:LysR family transcriptional regulator [Bordetella bronchialis]ANN66699.1 LysR family transcriptional regulator [Bordetella bronchialis]